MPFILYSVVDKEEIGRYEDEFAAELVAQSLSNEQLFRFPHKKDGGFYLITGSEGTSIFERVEIDPSRVQFSVSYEP